MLPSYEIIKDLKKAGFLHPEDRPWRAIDLPINGQPFLKYECDCLKKINPKTKEGGIEIILKPYCYSEKKKRITFYCGQCCKCESIYYIINE